MMMSRCWLALICCRHVTCVHYLSIYTLMPYQWEGTSSRLVRSAFVPFVKRRGTVASRGAGDFGAATLAGLAKQLLDRMQSGQKATTRLISSARRQDPIQPPHCSIHCIRTHFGPVGGVGLSLSPWLRPAIWRQNCTVFRTRFGTIR